MGAADRSALVWSTFRSLPVAMNSPVAGCRLTTRVRLRIMNRPAGFSSTAAANAARARAMVRQIASVS
jgi:hypothetical protein